MSLDVEGFIGSNGIFSGQASASVAFWSLVRLAYLELWRLERRM